MTLFTPPPWADLFGFPTEAPEAITNPVIGIFGTQPGNLTIAAILAAFLRLALVGGGIMLIFHLTWAGLNWMTSGADENKLRQSKDRINNSLICGKVVSLASYPIYLIFIP